MWTWLLLWVLCHPLHVLQEKEDQDNVLGNPIGFSPRLCTPLIPTVGFLGRPTTAQAWALDVGILDHLHILEMSVAFFLQPMVHEVVMFVPPIVLISDKFEEILPNFHFYRKKKNLPNSKRSC